MAKIRTINLILIVLFCLSLPVMAAEPQQFAVAANQSQLLALPGVERVAVANPAIADVVVVSSSEVLLVGKSPGMTTLYVWMYGKAARYQVEVGTNDVQIANDIKNILGYNDIRVSKVGKSVILEGSVNDQYQKARAEKVAGAYGEKVVNLLEITKPVQVKIEARVIEINRNKTDDLGFKWGNDPSKSGTFMFGQGITNSAVGGRTFGNLGGYQNIHGVLTALIKNGSARILSQPNVITLSGEKANILVGGEIPIPVAVKDGTVTVEWKEFGIKLEIAPEVNSEGLINSRIKAEVSTVDWSSDHKIGLSANFQVPPINTRKAETAIALASGQTMAMGGLIASEISKDVQKVPFLANIPILGKLFTSTSFSRGETELIILITPTIVNPQEYAPNMTQDLQEKVQEDPWGGKQSGGKN